MDYTNKTFIVTGASSGIGKAVVSFLLDQGAQVFGLSRRPLDIDKTLGNSNNGRYRHFECDLCERSQIVSTCKTIKAQCRHSAKHSDQQPDTQLSGIIFAHGYGDFGSIEEFSAIRIETLIATNLTSYLLLSNQFIAMMKREAEGDMILIGSEAALNGGMKGAVYCATKFGLRGFAQSMRKECAASGVRVCIVNPGMVNTHFFDDLGFIHGDERANYLQAEDIVKAVKMILEMPKGSVVDEVNISPQKHVVKSKIR